MTSETRIRARSRAESLANHAAAKSDHAIQSARRAADGALDALQDKVDSLPGMFGRAAARVDDLTRRTIDRARQTGSEVRERVGHAGDMTVAYVKDEPVKSMLFAAAAGAAVAALFGLWTRSRSYER
jgi:ElaB/YqjD/DUF883 family membrane-anchored ribosome-binding protein